jgi:hypothetical protein
LEQYKKGFLKTFITEIFKNDELLETKSSLICYWLPTLRNEKDLIEMEDYIEELTGKKVCRKKYDSEERTWANICYPVDTSINYGVGKTFYNRDDKENPSDDKYLQIGRGGGDCVIF